MNLSLIALIYLIAAATVYSVHAQVDARQLEVLKQIRDELPVLADPSLVIRPWTDENLANTCLGNRVYGISSCVNGWVTTLNWGTYLRLGTMPPSMVNMTKLKVIQTYNSFEGDLEPSWGGLPEIEEIYFNYNPELRGPIPEEWKALSTLKTIQFYYLTHNTMDFPAWIAQNWTSINSLEFKYLNLNGPLPAYAAEISTLTSLILDYNQYSGDVPEAWTAWPNILSISVTDNALNGTIPSDWSANTGMIELKLSTNLLTGNIPSIWPNGFTSLDLAANRLSGSIPQALLDAPAISSIIVSENALSGDLLWPTNPENSILERLSISVNPDLTGSLPNSIWTMPYFYALEADNTGLSGSFPPTITPICKLSVLSLDHTGVSGPLPLRLDLCADMQVLTLQDCDLTGELPESLMNISHLIYLRLGENNFVGNLPSNWSSLVNLFVLDLSGNQLEGTVPTSLIELSISNELNELYLQTNALDLCGNAFMTNATLELAHLSTCNVRMQNPVECGCPGIWEECSAGSMDATCPPPPPPSADPTTPTSQAPVSATHWAWTFLQLMVVSCLSISLL